MWKGCLQLRNVSSSNNIRDEFHHTIKACLFPMYLYRYTLTGMHIKIRNYITHEDSTIRLNSTYTPICIVPIPKTDTIPPVESQKGITTSNFHVYFNPYASIDDNVCLQIGHN